jgi:hypothetical protein
MYSVTDAASLSRMSYLLGQIDLNRLSDWDQDVEPPSPMSEQYKRFLSFYFEPLGFDDLSYENKLKVLARQECDELETVTHIAQNICKYLNLDYSTFKCHFLDADVAGIIYSIREFRRHFLQY